MAETRSNISLEQALTIMAYIVVRHGDQYSPLLERIEAELTTQRHRQSKTDRARQILADSKRVAIHA